ncbi:MAG TPA: HEAT repeat domain-containing protein [Deltaproteobacteria bacterium]|nr:HEAT repeat domain-containing protein [Candidatus Binatota bacterium]HIL14247.1 HEAT repeat domain-containing protein [Deltaproteobacteria bacterium]
MKESRTSLGIPPGMIVLGMVLLAAIIALPAVPGLMVEKAEAQSYAHRVRDRYNRISRGANAAEWAKRLSDEDVAIRLEAVESLGQGDMEESLGPLVDALADADQRVRVKAVNYLGARRQHAAVPVLMQKLFLSEVDDDERTQVLIALGRIADPRASKQLLNCAKAATSDTVRAAALYALGESGTPEVTQALSRFSETSSDQQVKQLAGDAIKKIEARAAVVPNRQPTLLELERRMGPPR